MFGNNFILRIYTILFLLFSILFSCHISSLNINIVIYDFNLNPSIILFHSLSTSLLSIIFISSCFFILLIYYSLNLYHLNSKISTPLIISILYSQFIIMISIHSLNHSSLFIHTS